MANRMPMTLVLLGDEQLINALDELGSTISRRVVRKASNRAMTPVNKAIKRRAPRESGLLRRSIGKKGVTFRGSGVILTLVGPRSDEKYHGTFNGKKRVPHKYAHLVEFGTRHSAAQPFVRPGFNEAKGQAEAILNKEVRANIEKEAAKLAAKARAAK